MSRAPKHQAITRQLATEILAGKYNRTGRLPSEVQLGKRFGVARPTIGQALRGLQARGLIVRRSGSGTYVASESPGTAALGGKSSATSVLPQLGMIVPSLRQTEIFVPILGELAGLAHGHGFDFWPGVAPSPITEPHMTVEEAEELCERFVARGLRGVFFVPFEHVEGFEDANRRITDRLRQAGVAVVLIDRDLGVFPSRSAHDLVGIDNFAGGYLLAEHLIKIGLRRFAYLLRPRTASSVDARIAGTRGAMLAHGIDLPRDFVQAGDPSDVTFVRTLVRTHRPDAVFCASDHVAAQLYQTLNRLSVRVPQDLRVVGFDNVPFASLLTVPLTTVDQPCRDIAISAFHALRDRIVDPTRPARMMLISPRLVVRESCGIYLHQVTPGKPDRG